jgi:VCBS repeat protein
LHDRAHGWLPHAQLADVDADGRPELVFLYEDGNGIEPHSWYVALRAAGPGLPIEQHPAFLRPSVVGFVDVNGDGRRDLLTRASTSRCTDDVDPQHPDRSICHGNNAPLRCRLSTGRGFGAPGPCPSAPDAERNDPNRGWAVSATGR